MPACAVDGPPRHGRRPGDMTDTAITAPRERLIQPEPSTFLSADSDFRGPGHRRSPSWMPRSPARAGRRHQRSHHAVLALVRFVFAVNPHHLHSRVSSFAQFTSGHPLEAWAGHRLVAAGGGRHHLHRFVKSASPAGSVGPVESIHGCRRTVTPTECTGAYIVAPADGDHCGFPQKPRPQSWCC